MSSLLLTSRYLKQVINKARVIKNSSLNFLESGVTPGAGVKALEPGVE